jgi:hypothetical protein
MPSKMNTERIASRLFFCPQHSAQYAPLDSGLPHRWHNGGSILPIFLEQLAQIKSPTFPHPMHARGKKKSVTSCWSCFNQPVKHRLHPVIRRYPAFLSYVCPRNVWLAPLKIGSFK